MKRPELEGRAQTGLSPGFCRGWVNTRLRTPGQGWCFNHSREHRRHGGQERKVAGSFCHGLAPRGYSDAGVQQKADQWDRSQERTH